MLSSAPSTDAFVLAALGKRMLATDLALKVVFEAKLRAEPAFAADAYARLAWFYERGGPGHPYRWQCPIMHEMN